MTRTLRLWIAAVLMVVLALPAVPAMARHGGAHDCCASAAAHHGAAEPRDCATASAEHQTAPVCTDSGDDKTAAPSGSCLHCMVTAVSGALAHSSPVDLVPFSASPYVTPTNVSVYLPATPIGRLERPPKLASF